MNIYKNIRVADRATNQQIPAIKCSVDYVWLFTYEFDDISWQLARSLCLCSQFYEIDKKSLIFKNDLSLFADKI